jgi:transposase-like protein
MNLADLAKVCSNEEDAIAWVESIRWPSGEPTCPHCGTDDRAYRLRGKTSRPGLWKCGACRRQFTCKIGTIFEDSHVPLAKWLLAIRLMCSSKKGVSASQISRELSITYKSAWHLCHRIRLAMTKEPLAGKLGSEGQIVEVDETYIGGKPANNKHKGPKAFKAKKVVVMTLIERDGEVRTFRVPNNKKAVLQTIVRPMVADTAHIMTDSHLGYKDLGKHFWRHDSVNHSYEYVRGIIHTNFAESYHSLLKRGIFGTYHHISEQHLSRYLREFEFRWNSRKATDGARMVEAVRGAEGKRLTYKRPIAD